MTIQNKTKLSNVYDRFREDSIAGFPALESGMSSKTVTYQLSTGEKRTIIVYFGKGGKPITATINFYKTCH